MTPSKAKAKLKAMDDALEIALHEWISAGEDLEFERDRRERFVKKYQKLLGFPKKQRIK